MKLPAVPTPFNASQISLVLELLDTRMLAPQETARRFYQACQSSTFSLAQQDAVELLFELNDDQLVNVLLSFADDDARTLVREHVAQQAQLSFVAA